MSSKPNLLAKRGKYRLTWRWEEMREGEMGWGEEKKKKKETQKLMRGRLYTFSLEFALSITYLQEPCTFSVQLANHVTVLSCRTSFHLWPAGGSGIWDSLQSRPGYAMPLNTVETHLWTYIRFVLYKRSYNPQFQAKNYLIKKKKLFKYSWNLNIGKSEHMPKKNNDYSIIV